MAAVMNVCSSERRKTDRLRLALGVAAGLPSLLWAVNGAAFIHDDWGFAAAVRFRGTWATIGELVRTSGARPLAAVWFTLTHAVLGLHPGLHALLLAAL
ncbi:MAG: hypothetical protein ACJ77J_12855, partial [Gemmatimonadaceae bacterium]